MLNYISKPKSLKISAVKNKYHSLMPSEFRVVSIQNNNTNKLSEFCESENVGEQIEVTKYLSFCTKNFLATISCMGGLILDETKGENIPPLVYKDSSRKLHKGHYVISRNASLGKIAYINSDTNIILNGGISYLKFKKEYEFYAPVFFIVNYGADYLTCITSGGGTQQNAKRDTLLSVPIPLPTISNHFRPNDIITFVSILVQNIIHKEEEINRKNILIDKMIEDELNNNQKNEKYYYTLPKISEVKNTLTKLDTGVYSTKFKALDFLVKNYLGGFELMDTYVINLKSGSTPNFFEKKTGDFPFFVRPTEFNANRTYESLRKIHFNKDIAKHRVDVEAGIILPRKGGVNAILKPEGFPVIVGDSVKFGTFKNINIGFLASFLTSNLIKSQLEKIKSKTNGGSLTETNLRNLPIPNFSPSKQHEIAFEYYNPVTNNSNLILENYLTLEFERNKSLGIFQLNMEILELKEKLANVIDKIIKNQEIQINL